MSTATAPEPAAKVEAKAEMPAAIQRTVEVPREGVTSISLHDLDTGYIKNYRTEISTEYIDSRRKSLDEHGMLQPVVGLWSKDGTKIYLIAGFCRTFAEWQRALKKLVKEYNTHFQYEEGMEGYISLDGLTYRKVGERKTEELVKDAEGKETLVEKMVPKYAPVDDNLDTVSRQKHLELIKQAGQEWADKFNAALKGKMINVRTVDLGDPDTKETKDRASIKNIVENDERTDPSLWDKLSKVETMIEMGYKQKDIAVSLGKTQGVISAYRTIYGCGAMIKETWTLEVLAAQFKLDVKVPDQLAKLQQLVDVRDACILEFNRRLRLPATDELHIKIGLAKDFAFAAKDMEELPPKVGLGIFQTLTQVGDNAKPTEAGTLQYPVFATKLRDAKRVAKLPDAPVAEAGTVTPGADPNSVSELAALQEHAAKTAAELTASAAAPATTTAAAPAGPAVSAKPEAVRPEDAAAQAEIAAANAQAAGTATSGEASEVGLATDTEAQDDAEFQKMLAEEAAQTGEVKDPLAAAATGEAAAGAAATKAPDGQMRTKTVTAEAVVFKYKVRAAESLEKQALARLKDAQDPMSHLFDISGNLIASAELLSAIGMDKESAAVNKAYVPFDEACRTYFDKLEEFAGSHGTEAERQTMTAMRPKYSAIDMIA